MVVLGCTGTGKSRLAIELALRFRGELVSADSMQVYQGLDIVTNKVSAEQLQMCKHHFIGCVPTFHEYSVLEFRNAALPLIEKLRSTNVMPIVVGGTNYYIESLLWNILIDSPGEQQTLHQVEGKVLEPETSDLSLYQKLQHIDPEGAAKVHPNDTRRVERCLEVFQQYGRSKSEILSERKKGEASAGISQGGEMKFNDVTVLWIQCEYEVLDERLNTRVDEMVKMGLKNEIYQLHETAQQKGKELLPTKGIFQAIGYKEFQPYLKLLDETGQMTVDDDRLKETFTTCTNNLKRATRNYARKQTSWIRNRFLKRVGQAVPDVYALDSTDIDKWDSNVFQPAEKIIKSKLDDIPLPVSPLERIEGVEETWKHHICDVCGGRVVRSDHEWQIHLKSRVHRRCLKRMKKQGTREERVRDSVSSGSDHKVLLNMQ